VVSQSTLTGAKIGTIAIADTSADPLMTEFPSGTVTFLLTDIEGSTRHWENHPDAMRGAVERHLTILQEAIAANRGVHFKTVGDAIQAAFPTAARGLAAAVAAQQALAAEPWSQPPGSLAVRMALHAGTATPSANDYLAPSLNRGSRLLFAGHGGQILVTETVRRLLEGELPPETTLRDLGEHRLRDLLEPERVWQVAAPGLEREFPPLRSLETRHHNLPATPTPLIGRESELATVLRLFREGARLVTLTGPGGTGKTRLALEAAAEMLEEHPDGVWFLELAGLSDPSLFLPQIAASLGVRESGGQSVTERLASHLAGQRVLLVLDNLEQFRPHAETGRLLADLVATAPGLAVLATSRAPLRLRFERELPLSPLPVPTLRDTTIESLSASPAVQLFVARAQAARPGFSLGAQNAAAIAALCRRLDGLPLALELAAARVRTLTPADILMRLGERLDLLVDPGADRPDRQRTMEAAVAWSFDLLTPTEQAAFRRLSVFAGGSTLEAAEAVLGAFGEPAMDGLEAVTALVEQGLLRDEEQPDGSLRFRMLEIVRVFSLDRLREAGEEAVARQAHADHFRSLVATNASEQPGWDQSLWLDRMELELDNLRAALDQTCAAGNAQDMLALAVNCWHFWWPRGYWTEARMWLERALANTADPRGSERARALRALGLTVDGMGDRQRGESMLEESLGIFQDLKERRGEWETLLDLSLVWASRDYREAGRFAEQALAVARERADPVMIARSLNRLGNWRLNSEHPGEALAHHREALGILESLGDERGIAETLDLLGIAAGLGADPAAAAAWLERAVSLWRELRDQRGLSGSLAVLTLNGHTFHTETVPAVITAEAVRPLGEEALALSREIGWRAGEAFARWAFHGLGIGARGDYSTAFPSTREALEIARAIEHRQWMTAAHCTLGSLHTSLCDLDAALREFETARGLSRDVGSMYWIRTAAGWLAIVYIRRGELEAAASILEEHLNETTPLDTIACRLLWATAAELSLAQEDARRALELTDRLIETAPGNTNRPILRLELLRGEALMALSRYQEAENALTAAREAAIWCGARPWLWRIDSTRARLDTELDRPDDAARAKAAARSLVEELAASVPEESIRAMFLQRALATHSE
jgi:predicted ATPase/class 3 adenylate cyclase